jgi:hypothetical protein
LSQVSPSLLRILQAITIITSVQPFHIPLKLHILEIHTLLDFSWDKLRMAFCSLRSFSWDEMRMVFCSERSLKDVGDGFIRNMPIVALDMALSPVPILWDLTRGCLRVMRRILSSEVDKAFE